MKYFIAENVNLKLQEVRSLIKFTDIGGIGVISCRIGKSFVDLNVRHFLRFVTGTDRFPLLGFKKNIYIEVVIVGDNKFPFAATCGLLLRMPKKCY